MAYTQPPANVPFDNDHLRDVLAAVAISDSVQQQLQQQQQQQQQYSYLQHSVSTAAGGRGGSTSDPFSSNHADDGYGSNVATCGPSLDPTPMRGGATVLPTIHHVAMGPINPYSMVPISPLNDAGSRHSHSNPNSPEGGSGQRRQVTMAPSIGRVIPMSGGLVEANTNTSVSSKSSEAARLSSNSNGGMVTFGQGLGGQTYMIPQQGSAPVSLSNGTVGMPSSSGSSTTRAALIDSHSNNQMVQLMMQQHAAMANTASSNPAVMSSPYSPMSMANASTSAVGSTTPAQWSVNGMSPLQQYHLQQQLGNSMPTPGGAYQYPAAGQHPSYYQDPTHQHGYQQQQYPMAQQQQQQQHNSQYGSYYADGSSQQGSDAAYQHAQHFYPPQPYGSYPQPQTTKQWYQGSGQAYPQPAYHQNSPGPANLGQPPLYGSSSHNVSTNKGSSGNSPSTTVSDPLLHGSGVDGAAFDDPESLTPLQPSPPPGAGRARVVLLADGGKIKENIVPCDATPSRHPFKVRSGAARFMFNPYRTQQTLNDEREKAQSASKTAPAPTAAAHMDDDDEDGVVAAADLLAGSDAEDDHQSEKRPPALSPQPNMHTAPPSNTSALASPVSAAPAASHSAIGQDADEENDNDNLNAAAMANGITNEMRAASKGKITYAAVRFKYTHGVYYVNDKVRPELSIGDMVVVEGDRGTNIGMVMEDATSDVLAEMSADDKAGGGPNTRTTDFLPVLHASSNKDRKKFYQARRREGGAASIVQRIVEDLNLPIQVCDAEFQCDFQKLFVFYRLKNAEAENVTLDLRELQKDLYKQYRCRIWLLNWYTELTVHYPEALVGAAHGRQTVIDGLLQPPIVTSALRVPPPMGDGGSTTNKKGPKVVDGSKPAAPYGQAAAPQTIRQALNSGTHKSIARKGLLQTMPPKPPSPFAPAVPSPNGHHVYPVPIMPSFNSQLSAPSPSISSYTSNPHTGNMYSPSSFGMTATSAGPASSVRPGDYPSPQYQGGNYNQQPQMGARYPPTPLGKDGAPVYRYR